MKTQGYSESRLQIWDSNFLAEFWTAYSRIKSFHEKNNSQTPQTSMTLQFVWWLVATYINLSKIHLGLSQSRTLRHRASPQHWLLLFALPAAVLVAPLARNADQDQQNPCSPDSWPLADWFSLGAFGTDFVAAGLLTWLTHLTHFKTFQSTHFQHVQIYLQFPLSAVALKHLETSFKPQETAISVNTIAFPSPSQLLLVGHHHEALPLSRHGRAQSAQATAELQDQSVTMTSAPGGHRGSTVEESIFIIEYYWLLSYYCLIGMAEVQKCLPRWFPYLTWKWRFAWPILPSVVKATWFQQTPAVGKLVLPPEWLAAMPGTLSHPRRWPSSDVFWTNQRIPKDLNGRKQDTTGHEWTLTNTIQHLQNFGHGMVPSTIFPLCKCLKEASRRAASFSKHFIDSSKRYIGKFWLLFRMSEQLAVHQGLSYLSSQNHQFFQYLLQDAFPNHPSSHPKRKVSGTLASLEQGWDVVLAQGGSENTAKQAQNGLKTSQAMRPCPIKTANCRIDKPSD